MTLLFNNAVALNDPLLEEYVESIDLACIYSLQISTTDEERVKGVNAHALYYIL